jgi:hypothetical protein
VQQFAREHYTGSVPHEQAVVTMNVEVGAARAGAQVLWVAHRMDDARAELNTHANLYPNDVSYVARTNGSERIRYTSGGEVRYLSVHSKGGRGYSADVISIDEADYTNSHLMEQLLPCLATTPGARIILR